MFSISLLFVSIQKHTYIIINKKPCNILEGRSKLIHWVFPLYFPQVANEHNIIKYVLLLGSYVGGEQLMTSMKGQSSVAHATSLPPLLLQEKTIL